MMKQAALWITILQLPVYISQVDMGGMAWSHIYKGIVLAVWVLFQNIASVGFGGFADKIGRRKSLFLSHFLMIIGYLIIAYAANKDLFLIGIIFLGVGSGIFKPILEGSIASELNYNNSSRGWSFYIIAINIGVIWSTFLIDPLRSNGWEWIFYGSAFILALDLILLSLIGKSNANYHTDSVLKNIKIAIKKKELWRVVFVMSGFTAIYMQFYEMLPNYFLDWIDSRSIASILPESFSFERKGERYLSYEWIFWLNPILVVLTIIPITNLIKKYSAFKSLSIGMLLIIIGISFIAFTQFGWVVLIGVCIYTFGELIVRPKFFEYVAGLSEDKNKSLYMSFVNLSYAIGYLFSALLGGFIYDYFGDKENLAANRNSAELVNSTLSDYFKNYIAASGKSYSEATKHFWDLFNPWLVWLPFLLLGLLSFTFLLILNKKSN